MLEFHILLVKVTTLELLVVAHGLNQSVSEFSSFKDLFGLLETPGGKTVSVLHCGAVEGCLE